MKFKNDIIELASKHGYLFKSFNHTKEYGFKVYKVKEGIDMNDKLDFIIKELKELKQQVNDNHIELSGRVDSIVNKNNLVE